MININRLIDQEWQYVEQVERAVASTMRTLMNNVMAGDEASPPIAPPILTTGKNSNYDFSLNKGKFELKCSLSPDALKIEYNSHGNPSGICVSQANYYVFVNPGSSKLEGKWEDVAKLRVLTRGFLTNRVINMIKTDPSCIKGDDGSKWVELNARDLPDDGWIADLKITHNADRDPLIEVVKTGSSRKLEQIGLTCLQGVVYQDD